LCSVQWTRIIYRLFKYYSLDVCSFLPNNQTAASAGYKRTHFVNLFRTRLPVH
jgi:hypothetical protein